MCHKSAVVLRWVPYQPKPDGQRFRDGRGGSSGLRLRHLRWDGWDVWHEHLHQQSDAGDGAALILIWAQCDRIERPGRGERTLTLNGNVIHVKAPSTSAVLAPAAICFSAMPIHGREYQSLIGLGRSAVNSSNLRSRFRATMWCCNMRRHGAHHRFAHRQPNRRPIQRERLDQRHVLQNGKSDQQHHDGCEPDSGTGQPGRGNR